MSIWGVVIGGVIDIVATNILSFPFILYVLITKTDFVSMPPEQVTEALTQVIQSNWLLFTIQLMIGSFCSILGGYIAAWIARHNELLNGALSAYLCIGLGIYSIVSGRAAESLGLAVLGFILSPVLALFGGYLRHLQNQSKRQKINQIAAA